MKTRWVAGCMTGTSLDGLDVSLVEITGHGLSMRARHARSLSKSLGPLATPLRAMADQSRVSAGEVAALARDFAVLHAQAVEELVGPDRLDLICVHGQTVYHDPPLSWQMFNPWPLCRALGTPVVFDLRGADLAAGGQGAPITPMADAILLRDLAGPTGVVNLGGFCNFTRLDGSPAQREAAMAGAAPTGNDALRRAEPVPASQAIVARDVCPCNQLLDAIARQRLNFAFDDGGRAALAGIADPVARDDLLTVFAPAIDQRRSLGTGDEGLAWIGRYARRLSPSDMAATACDAIAAALARTLGPTDRVLLAGGGSKNAGLVRSITAAVGVPVRALDEVGVPSAYREAICFAVLGALCQDRVPITLPGVTGCDDPAPVSGAWAHP